MNRSYLRRFHASAIFHRIRLEPSISQREIVERSGFDKSTVSSIVSRFSEMGLIERQPKPEANRRGRPSEGLQISRNSGLLVGVQIEAEAVGFVVCGLDGTVMASRIEPFSGALEGINAYVKTGIETIVSASGSRAPIMGVGVSLPGLVKRDGALVHVPVLGWRDVDMLERLKGIAAAPVFVGNDGKAAAMAERMFGACTEIEDFVYLFSGSGVGGALFLDGEVYGGADGLAGELGHIKVVPQGRFCSCGASGCLSAYLSEPALAQEIERLGGSVPNGFASILEGAAAGDEVVLNVLDHTGEVLGSAVSSLINIFNPPMVLLGGNIALAQSYLSVAMDRALMRLAHPAMYSRSTVKFSEISEGMPLLGGVAIALDGVTSLDGSHVLQ